MKRGHLYLSVRTIRAMKKQARKEQRVAVHNQMLVFKTCQTTTDAVSVADQLQFSNIKCIYGSGHSSHWD